MIRTLTHFPALSLRRCSVQGAHGSSCFCRAWALGALLCIAGCRSGDHAPPLSDSAEVAKAWERALAKLPSSPRTSRASLRRAEAIERLHAARGLIAAGQAPAGAWQWQEVRRTALEHAMYESGPGDEMAAVYGLFYDAASDQIVVDSARLRTYSPAPLAHLLVHEATHVVYDARSREASAMTVREMDALLQSCREVSVRFRIAAEVVAYTNQAAWIAAQPDSSVLVATPPRSEQLAAAVRAASGGEFEKRAFVALVRENAESIDPANPRTPPCSPPPVVLRGPRRGAPLDPWSAVPEFSATRSILDSLGGGGR